nr:glycosyltransferase [Pseudodesulfovibrio sp. S3-i]
MSLRFELFQKYCFPTVKAQVNQDFTWLVLFDEQTPARYKALIDVYARYPNFTPVFCGAFNTIMDTVRGKMRELAPKAEWFLTTRLDNDDGLSIGFVQCLHGVVETLNEQDIKPADTLYINFPNGLQFHEGDFYDFKDETNAFVSLLERPDSPHTVFWVDHPSIHDVAPVIQAETGPLWLQVVHDMNVYNYVRGKKVDPSGVYRFFPCEFKGA